MSTWSFARLEAMRAHIDRAPRVNHLAVLRILRDAGSVTFNENASGTLVNLSEVPDAVLEEVDRYVQYMVTRECALEVVEKQKEEFRNALRPATGDRRPSS